MERDVYSTILRPLTTEKNEFDTTLRNAYHFEVALEANKIEVRNAVEKIYNVKVRQVRIMNKHTKARKFRFRQGKVHNWKKAIVFLHKDHRIELF